MRNPPLLPIVLALAALATSTAKAERVGLDDGRLHSVITKDVITKDSKAARPAPTPTSSKRPAPVLKQLTDLVGRPGTVLSMRVAQDVAVEGRTSRRGAAALGPADFSRRGSAASNPMAPIGHYEDRSSAVLSAGIGSDRLRLEASVFNSQKTAGLPQSAAARVSFSPIAPMVLQLSYGSLLGNPRRGKAHRFARVIASTTVTTKVGGARWATTALWGATVPSTNDPLTNSAMLEADVRLDQHHGVFGRVEYVRRSDVELAVMSETLVDQAGSTSLGYSYTFDPIGAVLPAVGVAGSFDSELHPGGWLFLRGTLR